MPRLWESQTDVPDRWRIGATATVVVGDWGHTTGSSKIGVFRNGFWLLDWNGNFKIDSADRQFSFGLPGDRPVVGLAFSAKVSGFWIHRESFNTTGHPSVISFGKEGDQSVVGDWRGWGVTRLGVFRNGQWIMRTSGVDKFNSAENTTLFGQLGDVAVPWPSK